MKVSFSTLGCPEWSWAEITAMAKDLGFNGIEIRGVGKELYAPKIKEFLPENIEGTKKKLEEMGLSIPCFTSSSCLFDESNIETNMEEAKEYIDTASAIGTKYVRVLGDGQAEPKEDISLDFLADSLIKLADYAKEKNVIVLVGNQRSAFRFFENVRTYEKSQQCQYSSTVGCTPSLPFYE